MAVTHCRFFSGYKPCGRSEVCDQSCEMKEEISTRVIVIHLQAMGAVLRATSLLPSLRRKYPRCHITWVTDKPADLLFANNPLVDKVLTTSIEDYYQLLGCEFDIGFCIDKSLKATGIFSQLLVDQRFGFEKCPVNHVIEPCNQYAEELWEIGLSNKKKFFENKKPETQLMLEAFDLGGFKRDEYQVFLSETEKKEALLKREAWSEQGKMPLIGINIGCSQMIPYRKLSESKHTEMIKKINESGLGKIVLLGGPEEIDRAKNFVDNPQVIISPMNKGIRDGLTSVEACDMVISGDSFGMHMAIALQKWTVAWFGPTCAHEIDLYDRGVKVLAKVACAPCWKRNCDKKNMCYDQVEIDQIINAVQTGLQWLRKPSISKQPLSATSS